MRPVPRSKHLWAVLVFVVVSAIFAYAAMFDEKLGDSQINAAAVAMKRHDSGLYPHDPLLGPSGLWQFESPAFQALLELVLVPSGYHDLTRPFRALTGVLTLVYLCGVYGLLYRQCRSWSISVFVSVLSCRLAWTIGWSFWGVGPLSSVTPPAVAGALVAPLVLMFLRYRNDWRVLLAFLCVGLLGNMHLVTAMNLTLVLLGVYLGGRKFRPSAWAMAIGCGLASLAGAMLPAGYYLGLRANMGAWASPGTMAGAVEAFHVAGLDCLYPTLYEPLLKWLPWVGVLVVPALAVLSRVERFRVRDLGVWVWFIVTGLVVAFGFQGASQLWGMAYDRPPPIADFTQCASLLMLPLYVLFAQAITNLFRLVRRRRALLRWACAGFLLVWFLPSDNVRYFRRGVYDLARRMLPAEDCPRKFLQLEQKRQRRHELNSIAAWARDRRNTPVGAVFLTTSAEFRMRSRRSILGCPDDVKYLYYLSPGRLSAWAQRLRKLGALLSPVSGHVDGDALGRFRDALRKEALYQHSEHERQEWYVVLAAQAAPDESGDLSPLELIERPGWGRWYRLYRLN